MPKTDPTCPYRLIVAAMLALTACSAGQTAPKAPARPPAPDQTAEQLQREFERRARRGEDAAALPVLAAARSKGARGVELDLLEALVRWRLAQPAAARTLERALLAAAVGGSRPAWRALEQLAAVHVSVRRSPADALRLLEPLRETGCSTVRGCAVTARILTAALADEPAALQMIKALSPRTPPAAARRWQLELTHDLAANQRWKLAAWLVDDLLVRGPDDERVWAAGWYAARRRRGAEHREAWFARLAATSPGPDVLQRIIATREIASDRLLIARLYRLICASPSSTQAHWVALVRALARNHARGSPLRPRDELRQIALENAPRFASDEAQRALIRALLAVALPESAAPLLQALAADSKRPSDLVLLAELARQRKQPAKARELATQAWTLADNKAAVASELVAMWSRVWSADARRWQREAMSASGEVALSALAEQAVDQLQFSRPSPQSAAILRRYVQRLASDAAKLGRAPAATADMTALKRQRDHLAWLLTTGHRVGPQWRQTSRAILAALSESGFATVDIHYQLARVAARHGDTVAMAAAWQRAAQAARAEGVELDAESMLADLLSPGRTVALVRWLQLTGLREADDLALTLRVARQLLDGSYRLLGRRWLERSFARMLGGAATTASLPHRASSQRRTPSGKSPSFSAHELERVALLGAADLVLEYIREVRGTDAPRGHASRVQLARAELVAWLAMGQGDRADRVFTDLLALNLSNSQLGDLMQLAFEHRLCQRTIELATGLVASQSSTYYKRALDRGLECARDRGDRAAAALIVARATKAQISRERHIELAEKLARYGFRHLAVSIYDRNVDRRVFRHAVLRSYAIALLDVGRTRDALEVLGRMIVQHRRRPREYATSAVLLLAYGLHDAARDLLVQGLEQHPTDTMLRHAHLMLQLRGSPTPEFAASVRALLRGGPSATQLNELLNAARDNGRLRELYAAVRELTNPDRTAERFVLELAGILGRRKDVSAAVRRLKERGRVQGHAPIRWLREVGATHQARAVAEDILAAGQPMTGAKGRAERSRVLREALWARRDPSSRQEALGIARLFVGRALDRGLSAALVAGELDRLGFATSAGAAAALQDDDGMADAHALCREGAIAWHAGAQQAALLAWRRSSAALLLPAAGRRSFNVQLARICLAVELNRAGQRAELQDMLERFIDADPSDAWTWRQLIDQHIDAGELPEAVAALQRAHAAAGTGTIERFMSPARRILRGGGGPLLARWFANGPELRSDPAWLAFAVDVLVEHAELAGEAGLARRRGIEALAHNSAELRARLAIMWTARGDARRALAALGNAPMLFARDRNGQRVAIAARAAAATVVAVFRQAQSAVGVDSIEPPAVPLVPNLDRNWPRVAAVLRTWTEHVTASDWTAMARELVVQGHPRLAARLLSEFAPPSALRPTDEVAANRLHVAIATASDADLHVAALAYVRTARRNNNHVDIEQREAAVLRQLTMAGRSTVALRLGREFAARGSPSGAAIGLADRGDPSRASPAAFAELVRTFSPGVLVRMRRSPAGVARRVALGACEVAVAAGEPALAKSWIAAIAARDDEPWRAWMTLHRHAAAFGAGELAREAVERAVQLGAPAGVVACPKLWLDRVGTFADCAAGRPLARLPDGDLHALALAAARGVDPQGLGKLQAELAAMTPPRILDWIGAFSLYSWTLDTADIGRARRLVAAIIASIDDRNRREELLNRALDDLGELGLGEPGLALTLAQHHKAPADRLARNNAAYALHLARKPPEQTLRMATPALATSGGEEAHALLDTLASAVWRQGQTDAAIRLQRWALCATRPLQNLGSDAPETDPGLPMVRLAEFELARGRTVQARVLALLGLERERHFALLQQTPDEYADTGLPPVSALIGHLAAARRTRLIEQAKLRDIGTPITIARARAVLAASLRPPKRRPTPSVVAPADVTP